MAHERLLKYGLIAIALSALAFGLVAYAAGFPIVAHWAWTAGTAPVVVGLAVSIVRDLLAGRMGVDVVAFFSMGAALALGEPLAGIVVAIMYSGGSVLEDLAVARAERDLRALVDRAPRVAHLRRDHVVEDVPIERVAVGDVVVVRAGEVVPIDGVIMGSGALLDESALSGEPSLDSHTSSSHSDLEAAPQSSLQPSYPASVALDHLPAPNQMALANHIDRPRKTAVHLRSSGSPAPFDSARCGNGIRKLKDCFVTAFRPSRRSCACDTDPASFTATRNPTYRNPALDLFLPADRERLHQVRKHQLGWLPSVKNRLDDLRRKQCQSQNAADIGLVDLLRGGELGGRCVLAALYQSSPPVTACNRFQHGAVDARPRRSPGSRALGHDYQLAPAALPKASAAVA